MQVIIDLPEPVFEVLRTRAAQQGSSVQTLILRAIEKEIGRVYTPSGQPYRVRLPLIQSQQPGSLRSMTNSEVDALLD